MTANGLQMPTEGATPEDAEAERSRGEIVAVMRMGDANGYHHLEALVGADAVEHLYIVRPVPEPKSLAIENSSYIHAQGSHMLTVLWRIYCAALRLARRPEVRAIVSFNPIPYGLIAMLVGWRTGKPAHLGFVGSDWYRHCRSWYGKPFNAVLRRAKLFTVTGAAMKTELVAYGYPNERIFVLPHAVNVEQFQCVPAGERHYDCLFVGALIPRKRVDIIIEAVARIRCERPEVRLAIVGNGPERRKLEARAAELGLEDNVVFAGYQVRPAAWFSDARTVLIASDMEGFPFAVVEGWCAGAVPVSTPVGTIRDLIQQGRDGLLVPVGNVGALSDAILRLMRDPELYEQLRQRALTRKDEFRLDVTGKLWTNWLAGMWKGHVTGVNP